MGYITTYVKTAFLLFGQLLKYWATFFKKWATFFIIWLHLLDSPISVTLLLPSISDPERWKNKQTWSNGCQIGDGSSSEEENEDANEHNVYWRVNGCYCWRFFDNCLSGFDLRSKKCVTNECFQRWTIPGIVLFIFVFSTVNTKNI